MNGMPEHVCIFNFTEDSGCVVNKYVQVIDISIIICRLSRLSEFCNFTHFGKFATRYMSYCRDRLNIHFDHLLPSRALNTGYENYDSLTLCWCLTLSLTFAM